MQNFAKFCKIAYLWAKFSPRRRQVGQNLMRWLGKEIFRRFRISNQIFHTIYDSRDIERSLDPTLAVFGENLNFMDEYLENGLKFWPAVFCVCSVSFSSTFWSLKTKIVRAVSEKIAKNHHFDHIFAIFAESGFFSENPALSLSFLYRPLTLCKKSERSLEPFLRKTGNQSIN